MKYMENGSFKNNDLMKLTITLSLFFLLLLWGSNFIMYFSKMGLTKQSVVHYYLGSKEDFSVPRSFSAMIEVTHFHLPMMGMVLLFVTHLFLFVPFSRKAKLFCVYSTFASALLNETSSYLVRFVNPDFAFLKIFSFLSFQMLLFFLVMILVWFLWSNMMNASFTKRE